MGKSMVVVESPAKARTIERYLGRDYVVKACSGHIKDLPSQGLNVDVDQDFKATYAVVPGREKIVRDLRKLARKSDTIYLAADPDREGEAICQHLAEELVGSKDQEVRRVLFNEITKKAILDAFERAGEIDSNKVAAQQTRRILDRLVGYKVSPLLWKNVRRGLSAGRVQSPALRLIVDREKERNAFVTEEYWNFSARLQAGTPPAFAARAVKLDGKKFKIPNQEDAQRLLVDLKSGDFVVSSVQTKEKRRRPAAPFITSTLQQEASRRLGFSVSRTMKAAQSLYEGGLITYMRTDSTRVSQQALGEVRQLIEQSYGKPYVPPRAIVFQKKKGAQDAHEAIRPTASFQTPDAVKALGQTDGFRLYQLIWRRFVACQMRPALYDRTEIEIDAPRTQFKAAGDVPKFDGFLKVYQGMETSKPEAGREQAEEGLLPSVQAGEVLSVLEILHEQKFTQPPPRYSEATLVKALEEKGIGRPSTYQDILRKIEREYVEKKERKLVPTELGMVVSELLTNHFEDLFDYDYTARLEQELDNIEKGDRDWIDTLRVFYKGFSTELTEASERMKNLKKEETPAGSDCDKCSSPMVVKWGRFGRFIACSNYPECKNTREVPGEETDSDPALDEQACDKCGQPMVKKRGRFGEFLACSGYPGCKNTRRIVQVGDRVEVKADKELDENCPKCGKHLVAKQGRFGEFVACSGYPECRYIRRETTGVTCSKCGEGEMIQRKSKRGRVFYSCDQYPKCKNLLWQKPVPEACPQCDSPFLLERQTKREGLMRVCSVKECDYKRVIDETATVEQST